MNRILVLYGTSEGQTAKIAREIAVRLVAAGATADLIRAGTADPRPSDYAGIIVAASMHARGYQKSVEKWLRAHVGEFGAQPTAFVSVCLAIASKHEKSRAEAALIPRRFVDEIGWHPPVIKVIAGALPYTRYNPFIRWIMKRIAKAEGGDTDTTRDYEYTDWREVREFADRFAHQVIIREAA
ncbi:MAG TPA: flavodoxin domain-containing protein [Vicinamibacterales bacterium]